MSLNQILLNLMRVDEINEWIIINLEVISDVKQNEFVALSSNPLTV